MPKITLTPGTSYRYTGTEGVYSVILGELVAGADVPVGGSGGDPIAEYLLNSVTESLPNGKLLQVEYPLSKLEGAAITISAPGSITKASPVFQNQAIFENNVQMYQTLNVTGSMNLSSTGNFLLTHTGSGGTSLTIASTAGTVKVEGSTFSGNNIGVPGTLNVTGASTLTGNATLGGDIVSSAPGSKNIFAAAGANSITIGDSSSTVAAAGSLTVGGGYGAAGVTISSAGAIQANSSLTVDGISTLTGDVTFGGNIVADANEAKNIFTAVTSNTITVGGAGSTVVADQMSIGGGYSGGTGVTISAAGNIQASGVLAVDGSSTLTGNVTFGGNIVADTNEAKSIFAAVSSNTITVGGAGSTVAADQMSIGGGYSGGSGVTISAAGAIQANGNLTVDGTSTLTGNVSFGGDITVSGGKITLTNGSTIDSETTNVLKLTESDVRIIGATLSTDQTSFNLFNTTATTLNIGGAATAVEIGAATGTTSINNALTVDGTTTLTGNVTFGGGILTDLDENKSIFAGASASTITIGGSGGGGVSVPGVLTVGSTANLNGSITNIGNSTSDILNIAGTSVNFSSANALLKIGSSIGASTGRGIHIGQGSNVSGDGIAWEQAASNNYWSAFHDGDDNLQFAYNGDDKGFIQDTVAVDFQMNDFTGQHRVSPSIEDLYNQSNVGLIVASAGSYNNTYEVEDPRDNISINESLPIVVLASLRNQKSVIGVISNIEDSSNEKRAYASGAFVSVVQKKSADDNRLIINSIGEGAIWITNINGNLENGDYITSCEIPGYGMKQESDNLKNYTVAKITCDCNFDLDSSVYRCEEFQWNGQNYRKAFVGCTYHCG